MGFSPRRQLWTVLPDLPISTPSAPSSSPQLVIAGSNPGSPPVFFFLPGWEFTGSETVSINK